MSPIEASCGPLITLGVHQRMQSALRSGASSVECTLDLSRSTTSVELRATEWRWRGVSYPYLEICKDRTIYHWEVGSFEPIARYSNSLIKLVPTDWGPPTFEIDGIKMLPTAKVSPFEDAKRKVELIQPRGKCVLDTCGGLGYFAAWCIDGLAARILSYEKNPDVMWLRSLNPWSPKVSDPLMLVCGDITAEMVAIQSGSIDAVLHDPPRFGIAGELYSQVFYDHLARVLKRNGKLFHYTGSPNKLTSGRDVPNEVSNRLRKAGFSTELKGDGVLAVKRG